jgi:hypothetical protein
MGPASQTTAEAALSEFLSRAGTIETFYASLRDKYESGKPLWLTETADAACGGNPWASTFLDSFRYLDQLGRLAAKGVQVHIHNTLASSDYGLLDEIRSRPDPIIGLPCYGTSSWERPCSIPGLRPQPACTCTHTVFAARKAASPFSRSIWTAPGRKRSTFPRRRSATL